MKLRLVLPAFFLLLALNVPSFAQSTPQVDTSSTDAAWTDSLRAALEQFKDADSPTAADSAELQRWVDSVQARGNSTREAEPARARRFLRQALDAQRVLQNSSRIAEAIADLGDAHIAQSHYDEALARFQEALSIYREIDDRRGIAQALNDIGSIHNDQGRPAQALARYRESLRIKREIGDRPGIAQTLNDIGVLHSRQGRYEEALVHWRESLEIRRELNDPQGIASALNNLGIAHWAQDQYGKALSRYDEALDYYREIGDRKGVARTLNNVGIIYKNQDQYEKALDRYRESLKTKRELRDPGSTAKTLNNIGAVYRHQGHYQKALRYFREALHLNREVGQRISATLNFNNVGEVCLLQGRYQAASDSLRQALRLAEQSRLSATSPEARRSLLSKQIDTYKALTAAYIRLGRPDSALRSVEQARARLLTDRLAGTAAGDTTFALPPTDSLRETLGPDEAAVLYTGTGSERLLTALVVTRDTTIARELPGASVQTAIKREYPAHLNRLRREEGPLSAALDKRASPDQDATPSLAETIRLYRYYLTREQADAAIQRDLSRRFHGLLVEPIREAILDKETLVTVPTGALGYLPFETLRDSTGRHLAERTHVRYAQSLTVLRQLQLRNFSGRERPLLALGGASYAPDSEVQGGSLLAEARRGSTRVATEEQASELLRDANRRMDRGKSPHQVYQKLGYGRWLDLPETKNEANRLGRIAGPDVTVLTGEAASEGTVRSLNERGELSEYQRVHFATHGVAVPESPELSALVLSQTLASDSLASTDGYLTMEEIADLELRADVAVLSACQSGLGKVVAGEGVVSLSHAFLRAGANATLVSQWKVLDESTRQFMTAVYERAQADNTSFAEAVTETKRAFIAGEYGEQNADPLRWAPFVYYGRE